jgi:hypothetical protein
MNGSNDQPELASPTEVALLVLFLLLIFIVLIGILFGFWPSGAHQWTGNARIFGIPIGHPDDEVRAFVLVVCAGALGAYVHVARSAGDFIGNRTLARTWVYWYLLRLPVGASLALLVYMILPGSAGSGVQGSGHLSYASIGVSALAGMFSQQAISKLKDIFDAVLHPKSEVPLSDKLQPATPILLALAPQSLPRDGGTVRLIGQNFKPSSRPLVNGKAVTTTYVSETELSIVLSAGELGAPLEVQVENPGVVDGKSKVLKLQVEGSDKVAP